MSIRRLSTCLSSDLKSSAWRVKWPSLSVFMLRTATWPKYCPNPEMKIKQPRDVSHSHRRIEVAQYTSWLFLDWNYPDAIWLASLSLDPAYNREAVSHRQFLCMDFWSHFSWVVLWSWWWGDFWTESRQLKVSQANNFNLQKQKENAKINSK